MTLYWLASDPSRRKSDRSVGKEIFIKKETKGKEHKEQEKSERRRGTLLVFIVLSVTFAVTAFLVIGTYLLHPYLGVAVETIMTYRILAVKCLKVESMKVYQSLTKEGIEEARKAVAMIVGRDTAVLDGTGVAKAAIETVAEKHLGRCHCTYAVYSAWRTCSWIFYIRQSIRWIP